MGDLQTGSQLHTADTAARIAEFVDVGVPWHRALWPAGSVLSLMELGEYGEQLSNKAISAEQVRDASSEVQVRLAEDLGVGRPAVTSAIAKIVATPVDLSKEHIRYELERLTQKAREGYIGRWRSALDSGTQPLPSAERAARHITAHLLDEGLSPQLVGHRIAEVVGQGFDGAALFDSLEAMIGLSATKWTVVTPLKELPQLFSRLETPTSRQLEVLPDRTSLSHKSGRGDWADDLTAGLALSVRARDPWGAVAEARELIARLQARLSVSASPGRLEWHNDVAVVGEAHLFPLSAQRRPVRVPSLDRSRKTLQIQGYAEADAIDDALELLASLGEGTTGAAITGGWAALEGLLVGVSEKGVLAAERAADILTAAWPRAELTWLANAPFSPDDTDHSLHAVLQTGGPGSVEGKIAALESALTDGVAVDYSRPRDLAALHRVQDLIANPSAALSKVRQSIVAALRRLYVQRNLVMHAGSFRSVARATTLRTVPPLAAAALDRMVHAADEGVSPLQLAARGRVELELLKTERTRALYRLLD